MCLDRVWGGVVRMRVSILKFSLYCLLPVACIFVCERACVFCVIVQDHHAKTST